MGPRQKAALRDAEIDRRVHARRRAHEGIDRAELRGMARLRYDSRTFGSRKLSDLVRKTNSFEIDQPKGGSMRIRIKPQAGSPAKTRAARKAAPVPRNPSEPRQQRGHELSMIDRVAQARFWYKATGW